eukprot:gene34034-38472_t
MPSLVGAVVTKSVSSFVSGSGGVRVIGVTNSRTGHAVNMIGDYNNDGLQDFAVSASNFTVGLRHGCGLVIIVLGQTGAWTEIDLETVTSSSSIRRIIGGTNNDNTAFGDMNGDSIDDFAISAPNAVSSTGYVWFIYGYTMTPTDLYLSNLGSAGVLLTGAGTSNLFGCAIDN